MTGADTIGGSLVFALKKGFQTPGYSIKSSFTIHTGKLNLIQILINIFGISYPVRSVKPVPWKFIRLIQKDRMGMAGLV
jgi:hypothetical protein